MPPKHYRPHTALVPFTVLSAPLHAETAADLKREKSECKEGRKRRDFPPNFPPFHPAVKCNQHLWGPVRASKQPRSLGLRTLSN